MAQPPVNHQTLREPAWSEHVESLPTFVFVLELDESCHPEWTGAAPTEVRSKGMVGSDLSWPALDGQARCELQACDVVEMSDVHRRCRHVKVALSTQHMK